MYQGPIPVKPQPQGQDARSHFEKTGVISMLQAYSNLFVKRTKHLDRGAFERFSLTCVDLSMIIGWHNCAKLKENIAKIKIDAFKKNMALLNTVASDIKEANGWALLEHLVTTFHALNTNTLDEFCVTPASCIQQLIDLREYLSAPENINRIKFKTLKFSSPTSDMDLTSVAPHLTFIFRFCSSLAFSDGEIAAPLVNVICAAKRAAGTDSTIETISVKNCTVDSVAQRELLTFTNHLDTDIAISHTKVRRQMNVSTAKSSNDRKINISTSQIDYPDLLELCKLFPQDNNVNMKVEKTKIDPESVAEIYTRLKVHHGIKLTLERDKQGCYFDLSITQSKPPFIVIEISSKVNFCLSDIEMLEKLPRGINYEFTITQTSMHYSVLLRLLKLLPQSRVIKITSGSNNQFMCQTAPPSSKENGPNLNPNTIYVDQVTEPQTILDVLSALPAGTPKSLTLAKKVFHADLHLSDADLTELNISDCSMTPGNIKTLCESLKRLPQLKRLALNNLSFHSQQDRLMLIKSILSRKDLTSLTLSACELSDEDLKLFSPYLADNTCLKELDLSANRFYLAVLNAVIKDLQINTVLLEFKIGNGYKSKSLSEQLARNKERAAYQVMLATFDESIKAAVLFHPSSHTSTSTEQQPSTVSLQSQDLNHWDSQALSKKGIDILNRIKTLLPLCNGYLITLAQKQIPQNLIESGNILFAKAITTIDSLFAQWAQMVDIPQLKIEYNFAQLITQLSDVQKQLLPQFFFGSEVKYLSQFNYWLSLLAHSHFRHIPIANNKNQFSNSLIIARGAHERGDPRASLMLKYCYTDIINNQDTYFIEDNITSGKYVYPIWYERLDQMVKEEGLSDADRDELISQMVYISLKRHILPAVRDDYLGNEGYMSAFIIKMDPDRLEKGLKVAGYNLKFMLDEIETVLRVNQSTIFSNPPYIDRLHQLAAIIKSTATLKKLSIQSPDAKNTPGFNQNTSTADRDTALTVKAASNIAPAKATPIVQPPKPLLPPTNTITASTAELPPTFSCDSTTESKYGHVPNLKSFSETPAQQLNTSTPNPAERPSTIRSVSDANTQSINAVAVLPYTTGVASSGAPAISPPQLATDTSPEMGGATHSGTILENVATESSSDNKQINIASGSSALMSSAGAGSPVFSKPAAINRSALASNSAPSQSNNDLTTADLLLAAVPAPPSDEPTYKTSRNVMNPA